jgi:hypothetical protein
MLLYSTPARGHGACGGVRVPHSQGKSAGSASSDLGRESIPASHQIQGPQPIVAPGYRPGEDPFGSHITRSSKVRSQISIA